jgi:hypothetical protein
MSRCSEGVNLNILERMHIGEGRRRKANLLETSGLSKTYIPEAGGQLDASWARGRLAVRGKSFGEFRSGV